MRSKYRLARVCAVALMLSGVTTYLQWHYHHNVDAGVTALGVVSLVGLVAEVVKGRRAGRR